MDVVEHLVTVLRTVLDYVGVDLEDLPHPEWFDRRHELSVRYRTVVRLIASLLPPKPARRLHLQPQLLGDCDRYGGSQESLYSTYSDPIDNLDINSDDLVWVEEDLGNGCIQMRAKDRHQLPQRDFVEEMDKGLYVLRNFPEGHTSTPINQSLMSQTDPGAMMKISILEDELTKLRLQIAQIVIAQENTTLHKSAIAPEAPCEVEEDNICDLMIEETSAAITVTQPIAPTTVHTTPIPSPVPSAPMIPPPPPLPSITSSPPHISPPSLPAPPPQHHTPVQATTPIASRGPSLSELLCKKKAALHQAEENTTTKGSAPSLSEVLRGLGSVKLRAVERSPGGTPLREPPKPTHHSDPTFLIAQALKKKFAFRNLHDSLENDKENEFSSSSAESTPKAGIVPGLLYKKLEKRRSSLCTDITDVVTQAPIPLRDHNIRI